MFLFGLVVLFMVSLLFPSWGVKIPTGEEGKWFEKIWEIYLVVSNFAGLALLMKDADSIPVIPVKGETDEKIKITDDPHSTIGG
jgi:hypothetical protein